MVSHWGYLDGDPSLKNSEIVEKGGRKYMKQVKIPTHAGKWMAKKCVDTNSQVHWNIKNDNLSDTLQEAVLKATQDKIKEFTMSTKQEAKNNPEYISGLINGLLQKPECSPYFSGKECDIDLQVNADWSKAPEWATDLRFSDFASSYFVWTDGKSQWSTTVGYESQVATDIDNLLIIDTRPLKETTMTTLTLNGKLLSVLSAITQRKSLAITESEIGFSDNWMKVVRVYFYALSVEFTTDLGLKRNERCIRAIEKLEIPIEWLETPLDELNQFTFSY